MRVLLAIAIEVQVATIGAIGLVGTAAISALASRSARRIERKVGDPNGHGTVVEMVAEVLAEQIRQRHTLNDLDIRQRDTDGHLCRLDRKVTLLGRFMNDERPTPVVKGEAFDISSED